MKVLFLIENNLASSIGIRYLCKQSQKVPMSIQPIYVEEPKQKDYPFGAGWVIKTWQRTMADTTREEIEIFLKSEIPNCRALERVKVAIGEKDKEIVKEVEKGDYDLFAMGFLSSFDRPSFYELSKSTFFKKINCPVLLVKSIPDFEKVQVVIEEGMDVDKLAEMFLKLYFPLKDNVSIIYYRFSTTLNVIIDKEVSEDVARCKEKFSSRGISLSEVVEIVGTPGKLATMINKSGMVVSMINKRETDKHLVDIVDIVQVPVLLFFE